MHKNIFRIIRIIIKFNVKHKCAHFYNITASSSFRSVHRCSFALMKTVMKQAADTAYRQRFCCNMTHSKENNLTASLHWMGLWYFNVKSEYLKVNKINYWLTYHCKRPKTCKRRQVRGEQKLMVVGNGYWGEARLTCMSAPHADRLQLCVEWSLTACGQVSWGQCLPRGQCFINAGHRCSFLSLGNRTTLFVPL